MEHAVACTAHHEHLREMKIVKLNALVKKMLKNMTETLFVLKRAVSPVPADTLLA